MCVVIILNKINCRVTENKPELFVCRRSEKNFVRNSRIDDSIFK